QQSRVIWLLFFFQAEDGIRDGHVTGVQTCALPIFAEHRRVYDLFVLNIALQMFDAVATYQGIRIGWKEANPILVSAFDSFGVRRSEERRVGKEWRSGWRWEECEEQKGGREVRTRSE